MALLRMATFKGEKTDHVHVSLDVDGVVYEFVIGRFSVVECFQKMKFSAVEAY